MSYKTEYTKELDFLFSVRTEWLRELVGIKSKGRKRIFNKILIDKSIKKLSDIILYLKAFDYFFYELDRHSFKTKTYHNKGFGHYDRVERFKNWYSDTIDYKYVIYIFWKNRICLYVGRTGTGGSRPSPHLGTHRTSGWTRVTIHKINSRSFMPMLECLAVHSYDPVHNQNTPSHPKWAKACPLCWELKELEEEIYSIF